MESGVLPDDVRRMRDVAGITDVFGAKSKIYRYLSDEEFVVSSPTGGAFGRMIGVDRYILGKIPCVVSLSPKVCREAWVCVGPVRRQAKFYCPENDGQRKFGSNP